MSLYGEAERLMRMCVDDEGNPPVSPAPELDSYLRLATVCATLAVAGELRRLNEGRDQWYREVLEVLDRVTKPDPGPCTSRTPLITFDNGLPPQQSCLLRHGHEGMHESAEGARWTDDSGSPVGSGQPAAAPDGQEGGEPR